MTGDMNLATLFQTMEPVLNAGRFGFAVLEDRAKLAELDPIMSFQEAEGITVILPWEDAAASGRSPEFESCWITLNVQSALEAVGFLAHIATRLAALKMVVNPVAGYHHDHLFLPYDRAADAMAELKKIVAEARAA